MKTLLLLLLLSAPAAASSWRQDNDWEFGLHPGAAVPAFSYRHLAMGAFALSGDVGYKALDWLVVGLDGGYVFGHHLRGTTREPLWLDLDRDGTRDEIPFTSNVRDYIAWVGPMFKVGPWLADTWKPYAVAGCGVYNERFSIGQLDMSGRTSNGTLVPPGAKQDIRIKNANYFGFDGGIGFEVKIDENGGIGAEARYRRFFRRGEDYEALMPSLRLLYYF